MDVYRNTRIQHSFVRYDKWFMRLNKISFLCISLSWTRFTRYKSFMLHLLRHQDILCFSSLQGTGVFIVLLISISNDVASLSQRKCILICYFMIMRFIHFFLFYILWLFGNGLYVHKFASIIVIQKRIYDKRHLNYIKIQAIMYFK